MQEGSVVYVVWVYICCLENLTYICDWASEKGPSGHIKFDHVFQICRLITSDLFEGLP